MTYKNIVFDIDGTLIDTEKAILESLQKVMLQLKNEAIELDDLRFALGIPGKDALSRLGVKDLDEAHFLWDEIYRESIPDVRVFEGIIAVLQQLKADSHPLGIITSKTKKEYQADFYPLGLDQYFECKICADDSGKHKPEPEPMLKYLECSGAKPDEVLYIGDSIYDMQCAQGAGVDCALALWGCKNPQNIPATYYLEHPTDVIRLFGHKLKSANA